MRRKYKSCVVRAFFSAGYRSSAVEGTKQNRGTDTGVGPMCNIIGRDSVRGG
jgi:hypothetical protein